MRLALPAGEHGLTITSSGASQLWVGGDPSRSGFAHLKELSAWMGCTFGGPFRSCALFLTYVQCCAMIGDSVQAPIAELVASHIDPSALDGGPVTVGSLAHGRPRGFCRMSDAALLP